MKARTRVLPSFDAKKSGAVKIGAKQSVSVLVFVSLPAIILGLIVSPPSSSSYALPEFSFYHTSSNPIRVSSTSSENDNNIVRPTRILCNSTKGPFEIELDFEKAPHGAERILLQVQLGFFNTEPVPFFRVNSAITQFGMLPSRKHRGIADGMTDPLAALREKKTQDVHPWGGEGSDEESVRLRKEHPWERGTIASIGETQMIVVRKANRVMGTSRHDAPAGKIVKGMESVFDKLYAYNDIIDNPKGGDGPDQLGVHAGGYNDYILKKFPKTDAITSCHAMTGTTNS